jgi:hypothetical protein
MNWITNHATDVEILIARVLRRFALRLSLSFVLVGSGAAHAQEGFKLLKEREIRERVVGKDIVDSSHWVTHLRSDGAVDLTDEVGRRRTGSWKIQNNKLCVFYPSEKTSECNEVWMSGQNVRLRAGRNVETFDAVVEKHRADR